jgi:hypothetical protein
MLGHLAGGVEWVSLRLPGYAIIVQKVFGMALAARSGRLNYRSLSMTGPDAFFRPRLAGAARS